MKIEDFGKKIKIKYPQYQDIPDAELGQKMITKYPEYRDLIDEASKAEEPKRDLLEKVGGVVNKIFPGKQVGEAIGTLGGYLLSGNKDQYDLSTPSPKQVLGDVATGAATVAGLKLPPAGSVLKQAGQLGALSAVSGAGGAAAADKDVGQIFKSAAISGSIGFGIGGALGVAGKAIKAVTKKAPAKVYNTIVKTPLQDTKRAITFNGKTLGDELIERGVKGSDEGLFKRAVSEIDVNENKLQEILSKSSKTISRNEIEPYLDDLVKLKESTPGLADDVVRIKAVLTEFPQEIPIAQANQIKRNLYRALDDVAFKIDPSLSTKKEAMKAIAKGIKTEIENKTSGEVGEGIVKGINQELAVFGKLKDRSLDKIARANKNNLLGLGDMFAIGSGAAVGAASGGSSIVGGILGEGARRASQSTRFMTNAAVGLNKLGKLIDSLPTDKAGKISKAALLQVINQANR